MGAGFKMTIKRKSLPTRPLNVRVQAVPDSGDIPTMGSSGGGAAPTTAAGGGKIFGGGGGLGLPSSKASKPKKVSGPRGQYR